MQQRLTDRFSFAAFSALISDPFFRRPRVNDINSRTPPPPPAARFSLSVEYYKATVFCVESNHNLSDEIASQRY